MLKSIASSVNRIPYRWVVSIIYLIALAMDLSDTYIINIALPAIHDSFINSDISISWVTISYLLSFILAIPISGWLGDRFGTKKIFMCALSIYGIGAMLCGHAWNLPILIGCRFLQGIGGGMLVPVGQTMMFRAFDKNSLAKALGLVAFVALAAPSALTVFGGYVVNYFGWHWVFYANIPMTILCIIITFFYTHETKHNNPGKIDISGILLCMISLTSILLALSDIGMTGKVGVKEIAYIAIFSLTISAFIFHQNKVENPLLFIKIFKIKTYSICQLVIFISLMSGMGSVFISSLFFQQGLGCSALYTSMITLPFPLGLMLIFAFIHKIKFSLGVRTTVNLGLLIYSILTILMTLINSHTSLIYIIAIMFGRGLSFGLLNVPLQVTAFSSIENERMGRASSIWNTCRCLSTIFGIAIMEIILNYRSANLNGSIIAYDASGMSLHVFYLCFIFCSILSFFAFLIFSINSFKEDLIRV